MKKQKTLSEITSEVMDFANERGWVKEDPTSLINAIFIELGELADHYQWKHDFKEIKKLEGKKKKEVGYEFVDVFIYLLRLAYRSNIDVEKYFNEKMPKLKEKFKVGGDSKKAHAKYRKTGKNKTYD